MLTIILYLFLDNSSHGALGGRLPIIPDFNIVDSEGQSPVWIALLTQQYNVARSLIEGGADMNSRNTDHLTLLHRSIMRKDAEAALFLLSLGADIDSRYAMFKFQSNTALQYFCLYTRPLFVSKFLSNILTSITFFNVIQKEASWWNQSCISLRWTKRVPGTRGDCAKYLSRLHYHLRELKSVSHKSRSSKTLMSHE